ncbi:theronine dehydrogenase [Salmonella enterica]|nr:theronine dehydrogenase [Salmonella enterica]EBP8094465.1 theronine dehydrogenase [Salmonella enterica]
MKWRYSLRLRLPRTPCPGPQELASEVVDAGKPAPESVLSRWVPGAGYAVCVDFLDERQVKRWSDERKAAARRRNLERRVNRIAPLFADEFIEWELETRPEYFRGKSA